MNWIQKYLSGEYINLIDKIDDLNIGLELEKKFPTAFSLKLIKFLNQNVKYGQIISYSEIGKAINSKAYRAIGNALKSNPIPLIVPCHRVIRKNGKIGGFMGKTDNGWQQKIKTNLLKLEGVKF